jgi:hypothetical protein
LFAAKHTIRAPLWANKAPGRKIISSIVTYYKFFVITPKAGQGEGIYFPVVWKLPGLEEFFTAKANQTFGLQSNKFL